MKRKLKSKIAELKGGTEMNNETAIKNLNAMKMNYDQRDKESIPMQTIDMAIGALERQIPMKVIDINECPFCGLPLGCGDFEQDCCDNCGQELDWEEMK